MVADVSGPRASSFATNDHRTNLGDAMLRFLRSRHTISLPLVVSIAFSMLAGSGCGKKSGGGPTTPIIDVVPDAWNGVWSVRTIVRVCNSTVTVLDTTIVNTICAGMSVTEAFGATDLGVCENAEVRGNDTSTSFSCTENFTESGCTGAFSIDMSTTVNPTAGTFVSTGRLSINMTPDTEQCTDLCLDIAQNGTRGSEPAICLEPADLLGQALRSPAIARIVSR